MSNIATRFKINVAFLFRNCCSLAMSNFIDLLILVWIEHHENDFNKVLFDVPYYFLDAFVKQVREDLFLRGKSD